MFAYLRNTIEDFTDTIESLSDVGRQGCRPKRKQCIVVRIDLMISLLRSANAEKTATAQVGTNRRKYTMRETSRMFCAAFLWLFAAASVAQDATNSDNWEGLVSVVPKRIDALALMPGADVLQVRAGIVDLYLAAPDSRQSGRGRTFTLEAGEATLFLEARDSTSGALLGRGLDRRKTRNTGRLMIANRATNRAEFRLLFQQWADIVVAGLANLREISPVPEDLKPGQKLAP
jgi:hypothetical protein